MNTRAEDGVYALRYATRDASVRGEHFYGHPEGCMDAWPIHYYMWAILRGKTVIVVDAGFTREEAARRGQRNYGKSPIDLLGSLGVEPHEVSHLILTHLHYDHTGFVGDFPAAKVHVQQAELDFWRSPMAKRGAYSHLVNSADLQQITRLEKDGRLSVVDGDFDLAQSVTVHLVGGHTAGTQVVRVATTEGPIVLASDASHFYENYENDKPYGVVHELSLMYTAFDKLHTLAEPDGTIVPGHDPSVPNRHIPMPELDEAITQLHPTANEENK
ncbi:MULTISPECIES: N-acyl homoserine lactonase family protein [unclassified Brevibacterium]|uniref:N-acyl homoserine lactonase family protein n=1 Tax=unclassified Brevibacterium TaxID=2614124 RepID=UPI00143CD828|nr:N-acyl homoserine lactonase family protein [Brevibacterium sp. S22]